MIEDPIVQFIVVLFFGFCLGILFTLWYIIHVVKSVILNMAIKIGAGFKFRELTFKDIVNSVTNVLERAVEEAERDKKTKTIKHKK